MAKPLTISASLIKLESGEMEIQALLRLDGIKKSFGNTEVLRGIDLIVSRGEFITILGSCG